VTPSPLPRAFVRTALEEEKEEEERRTDGWGPLLDSLHRPGDGVKAPAADRGVTPKTKPPKVGAGAAAYRADPCLAKCMHPGV
jgi:hypothetical protein